MNPKSDIDRLETWVNTEDDGPKWWETVHQVDSKQMRVSDVILMVATYNGRQEYLVFVCVDADRPPVFEPFRVNAGKLEELNEEPTGGWSEIDTCCASCFPDCDTQFNTETGRNEAPGLSVAVLTPADEPALIAKHGITIEKLCGKALSAVDIVTENFPRLVQPYVDWTPE